MYAPHETSAYSLLCTMHLIKPFPSFTYLRCFPNEMILTFLHYGFLRRYEKITDNGSCMIAWLQTS